MVDVETERKAPAPGLKEKDEEEKSGIGIEEEEERLSDGRCMQQAAVTMGSPRRAARRQESRCTRKEAWKSHELRF